MQQRTIRYRIGVSVSRKRLSSILNLIAPDTVWAPARRGNWKPGSLWLQRCYIASVECSAMRGWLRPLLDIPAVSCHNRLLPCLTAAEKAELI